MTTTQLILIASVAGAVLFFAAGAALMALRQRNATAPGVDASETEPTHVRHVVRAQSSEIERAAQAAEIMQLRHALEGAEATVRSQANVIEEQNRLLERDVTNDRAAVARDMQALRTRADRAEAAARDAQRLRDEETAKLRIDAERLRADGERHRAESERHRAESERHRVDSERLRADVDRLQREVSTAAATNQELRRTAEDRAKQLERSRTDVAGATTDLAQLQRKLQDVERQLADKTASTRDLSTENEQLKGRLRDAEALRAEYVRLRTATTDSEYLKSEIARLEQELRAVRVDALGARGVQARPRPARGTDRQATSTERTIGESLARAMERFADAGTRSSALGDPQGFPLASNGTDGVALAAYAAHLFESASRAKEYLPVGAPSAIELVDTNGVRVSVWSLEVDSERLMLANLAVSPVDAKRVESALGDLIQILAPSSGRASSARAEHP